jgi:hypothetical protein
MNDERDLVKVPYDKFWDEPGTRREFQRAINTINKNQIFLRDELQEAFDRIDTNYIVTNMIAEKLNITRGEMEAYSERQKIKIAEELARREAALKQQETQNAKSTE